MDESGATASAATAAADPGPPSPLTGCYLLIVVGEPHTADHREIILQRIRKGLLSWDTKNYIVDLEKELEAITTHGPEGEETKYGERLIQYASENLVTEILIHPAVSTLSQCMRNLLSSFTRHRHIIHAGYTFAANGSWAVQDGTFSLADFTEAFQELEVQRILRAYDGNISVDIHCAPEGEWHLLPKENFSRHCKVRINPNDIITTSSMSITKFVHYLSPYLLPAELESTLESSEVVGNIRFSHPTLYVFPGGQGDAALFGINGFNMLLDGGFSRKACFWDFVRHLDRLDAVLLSRLNNSNLCGISSVLERKRQNAVYPQIGHFFCNLQDRKNIPSPDGDKDKDPLIINLLDEGQKIITNLRYLNLTPQVCYRDSEPINLYHKVGHGTLDMYVLNPTKDSKEVKEFIQKWNENDAKMFTANLKANKKTTFPLPNKVSVCALLIWKPSNPRDQYTRILFPGSSPQAKIFEGLEKLRNLDCINYPVCTEKTLADLNIKLKKSKENVERVNISDFKPAPKTFPLDNRSRSKARVPESKPPPPPPITDNKQSTEAKAMENGTTNGTNGVITTTTTAATISDTTTKAATIQKSESTDSETSASKQKSNEKSTPDVVKSRRPLDNKLKSVKSKIDTSKPKTKPIEKKASPTTPKKTVENKDIKEMTPKPKPKISPMSTPAKSTKEANNRKVVESKLHSQPSKADKKEPVKTERKPIARKPRTSAAPVSKPSSSPKRVIKPDSFSKKIKLEKEATDSSTVSTPSIDQDIKRDVSKLTPEELEQLKVQEIADLKEDREVVEEIEAVFRKDEIKQKIVKGEIVLDDKQEPEEYLIIEKEIIDSEQKDDETKKHAKDIDESEKPKDDEALAAETADKLAQDAKVPDMVSADSGKDSGKSPEEKVTTTSSEKKTGQSKDLVEPNVAQESQPDERISATVESGATTAPTLPEDERITLDEIKEDGDQIIEEKHVKEDTKEKDIPTIQLQSKTIDTTSPKQTPVAGLKLDRQTKIRDIVKTPDEVADLPVHEVVDTEHFDYTADVPKAEKISAVPLEAEPEINNDLAAEKDSELKRISDTVEIKTEVIEDTEEPDKQVSKESSKRSSVDVDEKEGVLKEPEIFDKLELGRKSPKEREEDVAIIVASVAEVLKSDAPLEEFEGKIPLDISSFKTYTAYTTELRETHITTLDSPIEETPGAVIDASEPKIDTIIEEEADAKEKEKSPTSVHRMLVTASSEDGGEETLICTSKKTEETAADAEKISEEEVEIKDQTETSSLPVKTKPIEAYSEEETSKESTLPTEELKEIKATSEIADIKTSEPTKPDELQISKDIHHDGKTTPTIEIDTVEDIDSGRSSPDEKVLGGDVKEDTTEKEKGEVDHEVDASIDAKDNNKTEEDEQVSKPPDIHTRETSIDTETSVSPLTSGKSSPDQFDKELSTPISSGKATPDTKQNEEEKVVESEAVVDGKEVDGKTVTKETLPTAASSGKASPDSAIDKDTSKSPDPTAITSGTQSPIDKIEKPESLKSSGKQTPESLDKDKKSITPVSSGKASPDVAAKPGIVDSSGKQTPEIPDAELRKLSSASVGSGKQSPDVAQTKETEISSKRSSVASDILLQQNVKDTELGSGKVTPELVASAVDSRKSSVDVKEDTSLKTASRKSSITTKEKLDEDKVDTMSIKSTTSSGKQSPLDGKMKVDNQKSGPPSGRQTPEKLELLPKELIKSATSSGKQSPVPTLSTKDTDSRKASTTSEKLDVADTEGKSPSVSGKTTPQIPPSEAEKMDSRKSSIASEKLSPEKLDTADKESVKSGVSSGKQSPAENIDKTSGKTTPDDKDEKDEKLSRKSSVASDKLGEVAKQEEVKSRQSSGRETPDVPATDKTDKDSRKASIVSDRLKTDEDHSGKQSPVVDRGVGDVAQEDNTASSRKSSKHVIDVELEKAEIKKSSASSGVTSPCPEEKSDKAASGKATPQINEDVSSRKASISSEKDKVEHSETDRTSVKSGASSGKATPDIPAAEKASEKSRTSSIASEKNADKPASPEEMKADESGKKSCSPVIDKQIDQLEVDDQAAIKSGTSTGKQTPELATDKVDKLVEKLAEIETSATEKQSPALSESRKSSVHSEKPTSDHADKESIKSDSGKQTPDIPLEKMSRKSSLMSDKLPSDLIDKDSVKSSVSSGKQSPDIPTLESSRKSSITSDKPIPASGKGTPDIPAAEEKDSRKSSIAAEKPQADKEVAKSPIDRKSSGASEHKETLLAEVIERESLKSGSSSERHTPAPIIDSRKSSVASEKPLEEAALAETDSRKSSVASEKPKLADKECAKDSPAEVDSRKQSIVSDKSLSEIGKQSEKSGISSGKQTPDIPESVKESVKSDDLEIDDRLSLKSNAGSGKQTPDLHDTEERDSTKMEKSDIDAKGSSGKQTPESQLQMESSTPASRKSSILSDKKDDEVDTVDKEGSKSGSSSGKQTPVVSAIEKDVIKSGKQTPDLAAQEETSRKSSIAKIEQLQIDEKDVKSGASSGKQSPEVPKELKSTTSSGRQTPDQADSIRSLAGSEQQTPDNAPTDEKAGALKSVVSPIISGKVTPELTMDSLEPIKSTSTSGRVTPEITIEQMSPTAPVTDEFLPIIAQEERVETKIVETTESAKVTQDSEDDAYNCVPTSVSINGKSSESTAEALNGDPKKSISVTDNVSTATVKQTCIDATEVVETITENEVNGITDEDVNGAIAEDHFINGIERDSVQIETVDSRKSSIGDKPEKSVVDTTVDIVCEVAKDIGDKISTISSKASSDLKEDKKSEVTDKPYQEPSQDQDKLDSSSLTHKESEANDDEASGTDSATDKFKYVDAFLAEEKAIAAVHSDDPPKITLKEKQEKIEKTESSESGALPAGQAESTISKTSVEKISSAIIDDVKAAGDSIVSSITATDTSEKVSEVEESSKSIIKDVTAGIKSTSEEVAKSVESSKVSFAESITKAEKSALDTKDLIKTEIETVTKGIKEDVRESKELVEKSLIESVDKGKERVTKESKDIKESIQEKSAKVIEEVQSKIDVGKSSIETAKSEAEATVKEVISEAKSTIESGKHSIDKMKTEIKEETKAAVETTKTVLEEVKSVCDDKVKETVKDAKVIEESVQKSVETIKSSITDEVQKLKDVTQSTTETIKKSGEDVVKQISKEVHSKQEQVEETIDTISKNVETYGENIITSCETKVKDIAKDLETTKESVKTSVDTLSKEVSDNAKQIQSNIKDTVSGTVKMGESLFGKFTKDISDTVKSSTSSFASSLVGGKKEPQPKLDATKAEALEKLDKALPGVKDQRSDPMSASVYGGLPTEIESQIEPSASSSSANLMTTSFIGSQLPDSSKDSKDSRKTKEDPIASWGKPLGLPSPIPTDNKGTPKKERKLPPTVSVMNRLNDKKNKKINPIYVELSYVPHHGNSNYTYVDFFKKVRARYYVFSGIEPSKEVYDALLEAKMTWEDTTLEVTIIPTYDTDVLGYWVAENEDALAKYKIDLSPSASRCTINLQDHETSCSAYRLEF